MTEGQSWKEIMGDTKVRNPRYCIKCDWIYPEDRWMAVEEHLERCWHYANGIDCMHLEGKTCCECVK